jgi:hypothetical protein
VALAAIRRVVIRPGLAAGHMPSLHMPATMNGMPVDDPIEAFEKQYLEQEPNNAMEMILFAGKLAFPEDPFFLDIFSKVYDRFTNVSVGERIRAMWNLLANELKFLDSKLEHATTGRLRREDLQEAIQLAIRHDAQEFNDRKRERYVQVIGNSLRSETAIADLVSYIQDVEQLGERDVLALGTMNRVMNKVGDWTEPDGRVRRKLHPNTFIQRRQELATQMAQAFGMPTCGTDVPAFSGDAVCARLQGFGLAHQVQLSPFEVPVGNDYCFRPSRRGLMLLIGEDVPNWEHYFPTE